MNKIRRILAKTHLAVSLVPWAVLSFFTLYAFLMRLTLGHWPVLFENTPAGYLEYFQTGSTVLLLAMLLSVPVWLGILGLRFTVKAASWRTVWRPTLVFALGWCAFMVVWLVDPVHFVNWFLD